MSGGMWVGMGRVGQARLRPACTTVFSSAGSDRVVLLCVCHA